MVELSSPTVSVVIVNWNTVSLLRDCLGSLQQSCTLPFETIIVDNASSDQSAEMVRAEFPESILLANDTNRGYAAACNQGIERSLGQYVLILNSDVVVHQGSIEALHVALETVPGAGLAAPALLGSNGGLQRSCWYGYPSLSFALADALYLWKLSPWLRFLAKAEVPVHQITGTTDVDHVLGACMLVSKQAIAKVGQMDEEYFMFLEETDWCFRLQRAGYKILYVPESRITHRGGQSTRQVPDRMLPQAYRSYCRFCRKNLGFGPAKAETLKAVIALGAVMRILLWGARTLTSHERLPRKMLRGYARVLSELPAM